MPALKKFHNDHIKLYGEGNKERMTGLHETANIKDFTVGDGNRGCSIRIPVMTMEEGKGYYEDRRPASNINSYLVSALIADTTILGGKYHDEIMKSYAEF